MHLLTLFKIAQYLFCWKWKVRYLIEIDIFLYIFQNWKKFYTTHYIWNTANDSMQKLGKFHAVSQIELCISFLSYRVFASKALIYDSNQKNKMFFLLRKEIQYIHTRCSQYNIHYTRRMYFVHRIEYVIRSLDSMSPLCDQSIEIQRNT